ncbi:hypothetical protein [Methylobacterium oryzisoli]|uniref:hypothetical protein n=1 Tax=Methylobacterium oryzisoli TaxID=3385502 RepID=UPI0038917D5E
MSQEKEKPARTDRPVTADDLKGVAAVPQDGEKDGDASGAHPGKKQGDEVDPGTG